MGEFIKGPGMGDPIGGALAYHSLKNDTVVMKNKMPTQFQVGHKNYIPYSMKEFKQYAKLHPGRVVGGVAAAGLVGAGAYGVAKYAKKAWEARKARKAQIAAQEQRFADAQKLGRKKTQKESAMSTDKCFQHLLEADLSGDKALVAAWQRTASEIAAKKRKKVMDSLAAKVKQYARPAPTLRSLADKAATVTKPEQPWYIRAGQKLGLLTKESTDSYYATLMEVMRKDNPELLAHLVRKARERMLYRGDKDDPLPGKKYMRLAKKQFDLHDSIKKRKAMADAASKTPIVVTPVTPKASGSLTPPAAPPKWSTRKKLALGAGIAAGVGLAGYGAYRWQKNRQKQQAARESTDTCLNRLLREGTPETRQLGRKISRQFARISEKAKKTGERGDYFIPYMLKLKAQRLAQQARHA